MVFKKHSKSVKRKNSVKQNLIQELNGMLTGRISTLEKPRKTNRRPSRGRAKKGNIKRKAVKGRAKKTRKHEPYTEYENEYDD